MPPCTYLVHIGSTRVPNYELTVRANAIQAHSVWGTQCVVDDYYAKVGFGETGRQIATFGMLGFHLATCGALVSALGACIRGRFFVLNLLKRATVQRSSGVVVASGVCGVEGIDLFSTKPGSANMDLL